MSTLWHVRVAESSAGTVTLRVHATHPDAGALPSTKLFAFRLLADTAMDRLTRELGEQAYDDTALMTRKAQEVVGSVRITQLQNYPFDEDAAKHHVEEALRARGLSPQDEAWTSEFGLAWNALWHDADQVPSATMTIELADPTWASRAQPGREWDTAAY